MLELILEECNVEKNFHEIITPHSSFEELKNEVKKLKSSSLDLKDLLINPRSVIVTYKYGIMVFFVESEDEYEIDDANYYFENFNRLISGIVVIHSGNLIKPLLIKPINTHTF